MLHRDSRDGAEVLHDDLLHVAMDLPADAARERIAAAAEYLDETIREVRDHAFTARGHQTADDTPQRDDTA